ncbi:hypothetical protein HZS_3140 [Henneguya salminicola]|nr:hypothetical protein HZS_3140 [Henneguya salminicola]
MLAVREDHKRFFQTKKHISVFCSTEEYCLIHHAILGILSPGLVNLRNGKVLKYHVENQNQFSKGLFLYAKNLISEKVVKADETKFLKNKYHCNQQVEEA